jgi:hypothetical protein
MIIKQKNETRIVCDTTAACHTEKANVHNGYIDLKVHYTLRIAEMVMDTYR